ncbi:MAG: type IV pili methyl-accepting chemotaxis transducer N-terminal domain-containing protein [Proteobacteria bacterium]|nr:type IV pili methyl-accepting chemotaxis transducer N-terminal domain-containing protein [Pseudomonadota bacterium]
MELHSVKSRFFGSYIFLIVLFVIQLPIVYVVVGGMSEKYAQVDEAGSLRKRAIEISYTLNRHILNGEEELEAVFQDMKSEYGEVIDGFTNGTRGYEAITDPDILVSLKDVKNEWEAMRTTLEEAMASGDSLTEALVEIENETYPIVGLFNIAVKGFVGLNDQSYAKSINLAGLQRMRTVNLSYLLERYSRSNYDLGEIRVNIDKTVKGFDETLAGLKFGSGALGLKAVKDPGLMAKLTAIDDIWNTRKGLIAESMAAKDIFAGKLTQLAEVNTPAIVGATNEFTNLIASKARSAAMTGILIMAATISLSVVLAVYFMWSANRNIIQPVIKVKDTVTDFASGNLTSRAGIKINFFGREIKDEVATLGDSVDDMGVQMSGVIRGIVESANKLASASEELASTSKGIEEGANQQTGQTAQVATAMEEMSATVIEVAKNAQQVSESSTEAQETAVGGGEIVRDTIAAMQEVSESTTITAGMIEKLGESSEEIGSIISVINDIADQTNLLALNAAIEAARAGEQGRGFAVVADEVRKLAERTTTATKEISSMIGSIQTETATAVAAMSEGTEKVENGVKLANATEEALSQIVVGVQSVNDMVRQIATSTEEQSATSDEISRNMDTITEVASTSATSITEVTNTITGVAKLATELKGLVSRFTVDESGGAVQRSVTNTVTRDDRRDASSKGSKWRSVTSSLRKTG